jgi:GMP reductase
VTEELIMHGADIVKVGIGPGSVCTTRKQTGVGYPQLSAVIECADAAHGLGGYVCADGGITCPGDAAKAFGGGSDFIMMGGIWAGTDEAAGAIVERNGQKFKQFYGMSSNTAMKKHAGGVAEYRSSEGKTVEVPYKGPAAAIVLDLLGGLRSACTYIGAATLEEVPRRTTFIRVTQQLNQVFGSHDLGKA